MAAGCWDCQCCSPLSDQGCPFWGKESVFGFLLGGSSSIPSPVPLHWPPSLLQGSWCRTPLLSLYCPLTTFQTPLQRQDAVRLFFFSFQPFWQKLQTWTWQACVKRVFSSVKESYGCWISIGLNVTVAVLFPGYLVKLLAFTFPSQPGRQNNNKPSDRQVHLRLFYTQTLTQGLRALLIGSSDFQKAWSSLSQAGKQEVCVSWAGDGGRG